MTPPTRPRDLLGFNLLELSEEIYTLLRKRGCNTGDARQVLALVSARLQEREARASL